MLDKNATNHGFTCGHCGADVEPAEQTARNHCPKCLWSLHVDGETPGDRASTCGGLMEPAALWSDRDHYIVIHHCTVCGHEQRCRTAPDDGFEALLQVSTQGGDGKQ